MRNPLAGTCTSLFIVRDHDRLNAGLAGAGADPVLAQHAAHLSGLRTAPWREYSHVPQSPP